MKAARFKRERTTSAQRSISSCTTLVYHIRHTVKATHWVLVPGCSCYLISTTICTIQPQILIYRYRWQLSNTQCGTACAITYFHDGCINLLTIFGKVKVYWQSWKFCWRCYINTSLVTGVLQQLKLWQWLGEQDLLLWQLHLSSELKPLTSTKYFFAVHVIVVQPSGSILYENLGPNDWFSQLSNYWYQYIFPIRL